MMKLFALVLFCGIILSCNRHYDNNYEETILGGWKYLVEEPVINPGGYLPPPPLRNNALVGYQFKENGVYEYKLGFFRKVFDKRKKRKKRVYIGTTSKYKIENDSLKLYDESEGNWDSYKIFYLKKDTLEISDGGKGFNKFTRIYPKLNKTKLFDKIIISSSGCYGICPVSDLEIDSNGRVLYNGSSYSNEVGFFTALARKEQYRKIEADFQNADWFNLKNEYIAAHTDDETITVTFIKDNKIIKTIKNYGEEAPTEFQWAYIPLRFLHDKLKLKKIKDKGYCLDFRGLDFYKENQVMDLTKSESFYLKSFLLNSKEVTKQNITKYKIQYWSDSGEKTIFTDGRFYNLKTQSGKEITLDIGFDFLQQNGLLDRFVEKSNED